MSSPLAPELLRRFLVELLGEAGPLILSRFGATGPLTFKHGREAVTEADREVEDLLSERILERYPGHRILGEEAGARGAEGADWVWHIDPIDGTLNYSVGLPIFSCSIAVARRGELVAGAVLDPVRGECFAAGRGVGAELDGKPLRVSTRARFADALVSTQFGRHSLFMDDPVLLQTMMKGPLKVRRLGSIALEMAWVAAGRLDLMLAGKSTPPNMYDVAAGILLVEEAGGRVSNARGGDFLQGGCELIASNGRVHDEVLQILKPWAGG